MIILESVETLETVFMALSDATRLRILNLLAGREVCVGHLVEVLNVSQPKVSRHLAFLKSAGLIKSWRDGKWVYYELNELSPVVMNVLADLIDWFADEDELVEERAHLIRLQAETPETRAGTAQGKILEEEVIYGQEERADEPSLRPVNRREDIDTFLL